MVERQDPDNFTRFQTQERCALEIATYVFKEAAISLRHLRESILEENLYLGPLEKILRTLASGMTFRLPVVTCPADGYK